MNKDALGYQIKTSGRVVVADLFWWPKTVMEIGIALKTNKINTDLVIAINMF